MGVWLGLHVFQHFRSKDLTLAPRDFFDLMDRMYIGRAIGAKYTVDIFSRTLNLVCAPDVPLQRQGHMQTDGDVLHGPSVN